MATYFQVKIELESPFPLYALPRVWVWIQASIADKMDDAGPKSLDDFIGWWMDESEGRRSWAVIREGEIGGIFFSTRLTEYVADLHTVFKKEFYGHKTTRVALAMVLEELFAPEGERGIIKIESKVLPGNRAVIGLVCSVGGQKEGLALGHTLRDGKPIDVVMVGIERGKFNGWNRRRLQLEGHEQSVSEHGHDQRHVGDDGEQAARAAPVGARHLRDAPSLSDGSAERGQPGADRRPQPGQ